MTQTSSNAKAFFTDIFADPSKSFQKLEELVSNRADENEWREFKGAYETTHSSVQEKQKKWEELKDNWSKAIGAFANSSGGVLIWGINAPNKFAQSLSLAKDAETLAEKLASWVNSAAIPLVHGIEIKSVKKDCSPEGLVVCLIPASRYAPHQSSWPRRQFYMRCQDGSHECGYMELKRLFQPQIGPIIVSSIRLEASLQPTNNWSVGGDITINNIGTGSANDLLFTFKGPGNPKGSNLEWDITSTPTDISYKKPLHPSQKAVVRLMPFTVSGQTRDDNYTFEFMTTIYATNSKPFCHEFRLLWSEFLATRDQNNMCRIDLQGISTDFV